MNGWGGHNYAHESRDPKWQPYDTQEALELNVWGKDHVYNQSFPKHGDDGGGYGSGNPYHGHHTMYGDDGAYGYGHHDHHAMYGGYGGGYGYYDQGYYH